MGRPAVVPRRLRARHALATLILTTMAATAPAAPDDAAESPAGLGLTDPILCKEIRGFEDYDRLPVAALTPDEKLLLYYRPLHYKSRKVGGKFEAHLIQDGAIRRKGEKAVLWTKKGLLEYKVATPQPPELIYLRNTIALKGLKPGEYEYVLTLRDEVGQGKPAVHAVPFSVVASPPADDKKEPAQE